MTTWLRRLLAVALAGLAVLHLAGCAAANADASPTGDSREQRLSVPVTDSFGKTTRLQARLCRPLSDAPARLVVINHGSPPSSTARPQMQLGRCSGEAAQWFLRRGYAVAFALRRGYGATGGAWAEQYGSCGTPAYEAAGIETARDIAAVVAGLTALSSIRPDGVVVVGQSAGGWGTIAYDSLPHPKVAAFVVMAGGRGGRANDQPDNNCAPDRLAEAAGRYGATATTPMLWVYAANDSYFRPSIARALYAAFTAAGGRATFEQPGPFDGDGHRLFFGPGGSAIWGPMVERYLTAQGAGPG